MKGIPKQILKVLQQLKDGENSRRFRVRAVLKWFGASRRGANVVSDIKTALAGLGIDTVPSLDEAKIDDAIRFVLTSGATNSVPVAVSSSNEPDEPEILGALTGHSENPGNGLSEAGIVIRRPA
jgi:hypothetical protein